MLRLTQLLYFQKVAELENMTQAAKELFISQPALSKTISQLESELGTNLFEKKGRNIVLNEFGKAFLPFVNQSIELLTEGIETLEQLKKDQHQYISIHLEVGSPWIPGLVQLFKKKYPNLHLNISQHIYKKMNDSDYFITSTPIKGEPYDILLEEEILLAVPRHHILATKESIDINELKNSELIGLTPQNALRRTIDKYVENLGVTLSYTYESDDPATMRELIKAGVGISFVPTILWQGLWQGFKQEDILLKPLANGSLKRTIYLCWPTENNQHEYNNVVVSEIKQFFEAKSKENIV